MKTLITNIGKLITGDIGHPLDSADTILIEKEKIAKVGKKSELKDSNPDRIIDVREMAVAPGLIDSHVHLYIGDYTPRQFAIGYIRNCIHGGVTTMISAGEAHVPGRPKFSTAGIKALAILAQQSFKNFRPGGMKVHAGAVMVEPGMEEKDFEEMAKAGVWLTGEIGTTGVHDLDEAAMIVKWARKYGIKSRVHMGGSSIPGSEVVGAEEAIKIDPDVACHINGGTTAPPLKDVERLMKETKMALEIVQCGNLRAAVESATMAERLNCSQRLHLGNDAPSGSGLLTLGIFRTVAELSSLTGIKAEKVMAMATGNTAEIYGLNVGVIKEGRAADLIVIDSPKGSVGDNVLSSLEAGDVPGVAAVIIDGEIELMESQYTPPPRRQVAVSGK